MSWYTGSLYDRTLFKYLRNKGCKEKTINKIAWSLGIIGPALVVIGAIIITL